MAYQTVRHAGRDYSRWIPDGATVVHNKDKSAVAYVYRNQRGQLLVIAYAGNAHRPTFHFRMRDENAIARKVTEFFANLAAHKTRVRDYRQQQNAGHTLKVGDIITNSWGYDQTNVDWYRIMRTSRAYVWLQPIAAQVEETGFMSGSTEPAIDTSDTDESKWGFLDKKKPLEKHKACGDHVAMRHGSGSKWDGRPMRCSWYA